MTDFDTRLGTALHDRVAEVRPDLDHLVTASMRAGTRIRMRRRVGVSVAAAAGVACVALGAAVISGGNDPRPAGDGVDFAAEPSPTPTAPTPSTPPTPATPLAQELPVHVRATLVGWECGIPADEKFPCSKGTYALSVNVRPLDELSSWSGSDPDRPKSQVTHTGANYFVTLQPGAGTPETIVAELRDGLRFDKRWRQLPAQ